MVLGCSESIPPVWPKVGFPITLDELPPKGGEMLSLLLGECTTIDKDADELGCPNIASLFSTWDIEDTGALELTCGDVNSAAKLP